MILFHLMWVCSILTAQPVPIDPYTGEGLEKPNMIETEVHRDRYFITSEEADNFIKKAPKNCSGWFINKEKFIKESDCSKYTLPWKVETIPLTSPHEIQ